jgi:ribonuclease BN (tRNA processing enzyme)
VGAARTPARLAHDDPDLKLHVLGSGDAFGSGGRFQTCLLLESARTRLLVDCGATSLVAMRRAGVDPLGIDAVVLSHLHGDHFGGLPFLILDAQFRRRAAPLVVAGPAGVRARVEAAMEVFFPGSTGVARRFAVEFIELTDGIAVDVGALTVTPFAVVHASGAPAHALRFEDGARVVTYSGDTEWTTRLLDAARGADLFVCEAYTFDRAVKFHLDHETIRAHRDAFGCRRIVLTHMGPEMLAREGEAAFERAHDGLVLEI